MVHSPDSLIPSLEGQPTIEKRDDKATVRRRGGEANARAATQVNAVTASSTPPTSKPIQLELFSGRACLLEAKPAITWIEVNKPGSRDGVQGGGTRRKRIKITGETLPGLAQEASREAHKGKPRKRRNEARQGVGDGHSTAETRESRGKGRAVTSIKRTKKGKTTGLPPRGKAQPRSKSGETRMDNVRKLQRALYRAAKQQPERRFTLLYDKISRSDVLREAWKRVKRNKGAAGVDKVDIEDVQTYGEERFLVEIADELRQGAYRVNLVRRVYIPKPGQPNKRRPLGIPTVKDRVVQMAVKLVIEPLFEADFLPNSYGFRPQRTPRMALSEIATRIRAGYIHVVDVDLKSYFDTIDHEVLTKLVERRVGDKRVLRLIRAWLKAGILEEGQITHPLKGSPQGGVISPLLSNVMLHEIDRQWHGNPNVILVRYADDMVLLTRKAADANQVWENLQQQFAALHLEVNQDKSKITTVAEGFAFLGFEFRKKPHRNLYMWPREKSCKHLKEKIRTTVRTVPSNAPLHTVIHAVNPILIGWCTYFRVANSNRVFHEMDWAVRSEIQLWLRRKYRCDWKTARRRGNYRYLHKECRLYRLTGKVSHLEGLR